MTLSHLAGKGRLKNLVARNRGGTSRAYGDCASRLTSMAVAAEPGRVQRTPGSRSSRGPTLQNMVPRAILTAENRRLAAAFERPGRRKPSATARRAGDWSGTGA